MLNVGIRYAGSKKTSFKIVNLFKVSFMLMFLMTKVGQISCYFDTDVDALVKKTYENFSISCLSPSDYCSVTIELKFITGYRLI